MLLEVRDSAGRGVPMERNKVNLAIARTGSEELIEPVYALWRTRPDGVGDGG